MLSSRLPMSEARLFSDCEVKKLVGLSSAELTLLPVARSFWVVASSEAVDCNERRFWRTDAERTMPDISIPFWIWTRLTRRRTFLSATAPPCSLGPTHSLIRFSVELPGARERGDDAAQGSPYGAVLIA